MLSAKIPQSQPTNRPTTYLTSLFAQGPIKIQVVEFARWTHSSIRLDASSQANSYAGLVFSREELKLSDKYLSKWVSNAPRSQSGWLVCWCPHILLCEFNLFTWRCATGNNKNSPSVFNIIEKVAPWEVATPFFSLQCPLGPNRTKDLLKLLLWCARLKFK